MAKAPYGDASVENGVSCVGGWGAGGAAGKAGVRALGTEKVLLGAEGGGAAGTAVDDYEADEMEAFGMAGQRWNKIEKNTAKVSKTLLRVAKMVHVDECTVAYQLANCSH